MDHELDIVMDIHTACNVGDEDLVKEILQCSTTVVDARNSGGWTPLMYACWGGHERLVTLLLNCGASKMELNDDHQPPLIIAVKGGHLAIVKLVLQKNFLLHKDSNGKCALFYAVEFGYFDIANYLLMEGADVNFSCDGVTVLMVAAMSGQHTMVQLLLNYGANIHVCNKQGFIAQQLATSKGHPDIAAMLDVSHIHNLPDLKSFLESLGLEKYYTVFEGHKIDFQRFLQMDEMDFKSLGIKLLGPRRKLSLAIAAFRKRCPKM